MHFFFLIAHSGVSNSRGDTGALKAKMAKPHILVMSLPEDRVRHLRSRRKRQATGDAVCSELSTFKEFIHFINKIQINISCLMLPLFVLFLPCALSPFHCPHGLFFVFYPGSQMFAV